MIFSTEEDVLGYGICISCKSNNFGKYKDFMFLIDTADYIV